MLYYTQCCVLCRCILNMMYTVLCRCTLKVLYTVLCVVQVYSEGVVHSVVCCADVFLTCCTQCCVLCRCTLNMLYTVLCKCTLNMLYTVLCVMQTYSEHAVHSVVLCRCTLNMLYTVLCVVQVYSERAVHGGGDLTHTQRRRERKGRTSEGGFPTRDG